MLNFCFISKFKANLLNSNPSLSIYRCLATIQLCSPTNSNEPHELFEEMPEPEDFRTWNIRIRDYSLHSMHKEALSFFFSRRRSMDCFRPDQLAFAALVKSCCVVSGIRVGEAFHGYGLKLGFNESNGVVSKALMNMYAKCGNLDGCMKMYDQTDLMGDPVAWNIILSGYAGFRSNVGPADTLRLFYAMHVCEYEPKPNEVTVAIILPICAWLRVLNAGKSVHGYVIKSGLESKTLVGNALVSMYAKCGCLNKDAIIVFRGITYKDVVSWNAIIAGYVENGYSADSFKLFREMLMGPNEPNYATFANVLPVCASMGHERVYHLGKEIHGYVLKRLELVGEISVCNSLLSFYSKICKLKEAEFIFRRMESKDLVSWNAIIAGYASGGGSHKSMELFHEMLSTGIVRPDSVTIISILPVCTQLRNLQEGRKVHEYVLRCSELCGDTAVGNALISFYSKCNDVETAFQTFLMMPKKDLISWNAMLDAYAESGCVMQFVELLHRMFQEGIRPDSITMLTVVHVCASVSNVKKIKEAHGYSLRSGLLVSFREPTLGNAILDSYAKCGNMEYATKTFESLSGKRNVVTGNAMISGYISCGLWEDAEIIFTKMGQTDLTTWNLMIRAYAENDCPAQAINLFYELQLRGMKPDMMSIMSLIPVCARLASVHLVRQCHGYVVRSSLEDLRLWGALLDVYSKCGSIGSAYKLFQSIPQKDLVMFTAMLSGYAMHGMGEEALKVFSEMLKFGVKPDHVIITAVLSACSHSGLVDEGWKLFESIETVYGIKPTMEHYACVVDLLARGGRLREAYSFVTAMPIEANANVWGTLLGACRIRHEVELGRVVADHLFEVETNNIGNYVVMSNIFAANSKWDEVRKVRRLMRERDLTKPAGCSWIEVENKRHVFIAGDVSHPERITIYDTASILDQQIKGPF